MLAGALALAAVELVLLEVEVELVPDELALVVEDEVGAWLDVTEEEGGPKVEVGTW